MMSWCHPPLSRGAQYHSSVTPCRPHFSNTGRTPPRVTRLCAPNLCRREWALLLPGKHCSQHRKRKQWATPLPRLPDIARPTTSSSCPRGSRPGVVAVGSCPCEEEGLFDPCLFAWAKGCGLHFQERKLFSLGEKSAFLFVETHSPGSACDSRAFTPPQSEACGFSGPSFMTPAGPLGWAGGWACGAPGPSCCLTSRRACPASRKEGRSSDVAVGSLSQGPASCPRAAQTLG